MAKIVLPDVGQVVRFAVTGTWQGQPCTNIFHGRYSQGSLDSAAISAACNSVITAYANTFTAIQSSTFTGLSCVGQDLSSRTSPIGSATATHNGGDVSGSATSVQIAVCVSWEITDRYRGGHPRSYIPGMVASDSTNGRLLTSAAHVKWTNAAAGFLTDFNAMSAGAATWSLVCVRYFSQGQLLPNPFVRVINTSIVHQRLDSQRRRLGKEIA